jgi:predicted aspartyl protease|uniref:retroviral-like aspartic protease family protein n=1 Tax=uncultured Sphingomonas sp. TaxID=158754 RepID=UPI0035CA51FF
MNPALLLAVPFAAALATPQPVPQPTPDPVAQQSVQQNPAEQLAFVSDGLRMTVPVTIGPAGPYRFVVDTGAERTVISRELAGTLGLAPGRSVHVTAMAGSAQFATVVIPDIKIGSPNTGARLIGTRIEAPAFIANNLGAAGLIGIDTLQGHAVSIDFVQQLMTVTPSTKRTRTERFGPDDIVIRARNLFGQLVVTDATYRGRKVRVVIDTGADTSMGNMALRKLAAPGGKGTTPLALLSVTGAMLQTDYTLLDRVQIGDISLASLPVAFADAAPFGRLGLSDRPALLLGMDALRLFGRVRIDFANREVRLAQPKRAER